MKTIKADDNVAMVTQYPENETEWEQVQRSPHKWLTDNYNKNNPLYPMMTLLAAKNNWAERDLLAFALLMVDHFSCEMRDDILVELSVEEMMPANATKH